jgi:hypothetical protein
MGIPFATDHLTVQTAAAAELTGVFEPSRTDQPSEDARWRQWKTKAGDDEARSRRRLKVVVVDAAAALAIAGACWFAFTI